MIDRNRRLSIFVGLGSAVVAGLVGIPAAISALSPAWKHRHRGERWRSAGKLDLFSLERIEPAVVQVGRDDWARSLDKKTVYVYRRSADEVVVYSRNCTDLSCPLVFDAGSECFFCPCHGAIFGKEGNPMAGPPKRPLYRYANRVRDGYLEIDLDSLPPMT
jgi:menaquinol-cytochrome c reductase iron-sulfur subunit